MSADKLYQAPGDFELEVSVFGPGYGESVLVHLGRNRWLIVDSCVDPESGDPAPLQYLNRIGVKPNDAVKLVVATHWHDDHIAGLARIVEQCAQAEFTCSQALTCREFFELAQFSKRSITTRPGMEQFSKVLSILAERKQGRLESRGPEWASICKVLYVERDQRPLCEVTSLSPSSGQITLFLNQISSLLPAEYNQQRRLVSVQPNHAAVVLWVCVENTRVLLGSDLEETPNPNTGWSVIVESKNRPPGKASVFKVPHHGSRNADQPRVWSEMVEHKPHAVLTPFNLGLTSLPTKRDAERICRRTENAYSTARLPKTTKRNPTVERTIKEVTRKFRTISSAMGHVRLRKAVDRNDSWNVDLIGDALPLDQLSKLL